MRTLAMHGGKPLVTTPIKPLQTIGDDEVEAVEIFMGSVARGATPLSGYLAGPVSRPLRSSCN